MFIWYSDYNFKNWKYIGFKFKKWVLQFSSCKLDSIENSPFHLKALFTKSNKPILLLSKTIKRLPSFNNLRM